MRKTGFLAAALLAACLASTATAAEKTLLDPLIGEWNVSPPGGVTAFIERFSFGPSQGYVWVQVALIQPSGEEHLHFEGMSVWNAATGRFDYLYAVEPGSGVQEKGEIYAGDGGVIVRDVTLTAADGSTATFRQTFRDLGDGRFETALMRKSADGWQPTFPGSERLIMTRRTT